MGISKGRIFLKKASSRDLNVVRKKDQGLRKPIESKPGRRPSSPKDKGKGGEIEQERVRVPIQLTRAQALRLKAAAAERHMTVAELVYAAVDRYLAGPPSSKPSLPTLTRKELENLLKNR